MLTYTDALSHLSRLTLKPQSEFLPLDAAVGRVVAQDIQLQTDQPSFDRATMDGYALCLKDGTTTFTVRGTVFAGISFTGTLAPGDAVRIMTGAPVPKGTTVVPHELTDRGETVVTVTDVKALALGRNIAWQGEDGRAGASVIRAGTRLSPLVLSLAAMAGIMEVHVLIAPRLGIVTTGDEVGGAGPAGINDSNGPFLSGFAHALGLTATRTHTSDSEHALRSAIQQAHQHHDIIVTTGGVSAGAKDLVPAIAAELGFKTIFHHVAIQPGKPILLMQKGDKFLIGLPGNPVSVIATAHLFLLPLIHRLLGAPAPTWLTLPLTVAAANKSPRQQFMPARLTVGGVERTAWNGSGDLIAAACSDGLIDLPVGSAFAVGSPVRFLPFIGWQPGMTGSMPARQPR